MWKLGRKRKLSAAITRSQGLLAEGRHRENLEYLKGGVAESFPQDPEIRLLYGTALLEENPRLALSEIAKAIDLDPGDPVRLTRAARIMYSMRQFECARNLTERARALAPEEFVYAPELLNLESNLAALEGRDGVAEEGLRRAMDQEPAVEIMAYDLAKFLAERGRREEALGVIDEALKRTKNTKYLRRLRTELLDS